MTDSQTPKPPSKKVVIHRRVKVKKLDGVEYVSTTQKALLVKKGFSRSLVQLDNGDIIQRKNKDIEWTKKEVTLNT